MKHKIQIKIMDKDVLNGIIARYEALREETIVENEYFDDAEGKFVRLNDVVVDYPGVTLYDYHITHEGHPNRVIYRAIGNYIDQYVDLEQNIRKPIGSRILSVFKSAYLYAHIAKDVENPIQDLFEIRSKLHYLKIDEIDQVLIIGVMTALLKLDSSLTRTPELKAFIERVEKFYSDETYPINGVKPFYPILKEALNLDEITFETEQSGEREGEFTTYSEEDVKSALLEAKSEYLEKTHNLNFKKSRWKAAYIVYNKICCTYGIELKAFSDMIVDWGLESRAIYNDMSKCNIDSNLPAKLSKWRDYKITAKKPEKDFIDFGLLFWEKLRAKKN